MAGQSDLYAALIGDAPNSAEKQAALVDLLRRRSGLAQVAQLSGDPTLAPMGRQQSQEVEQQAGQLQQQQAQQQTMQARQAQQQAQMQFQQQQEARQAQQARQQMDVTRRGQDMSSKSALANTLLRKQELEAQKAAAANKPAAQPTESERKNATLATRLEGSLQELSELGSAAEKPGLTERALESAGLEAGANSVRTSERRRANAAQLDALDAALTLGTGATYTKEQLANFKTQYFPQIGDDQKTVEAKQKRFETIVAAARNAAGRAPLTVTPQKRRKFNPATGKIE